VIRATTRFGSFVIPAQAGFSTAELVIQHFHQIAEERLPAFAHCCPE
jgi:hypothetical protein